MRTLKQFHLRRINFTKQTSSLCMLTCVYNIKGSYFITTVHLSGVLIYEYRTVGDKKRQSYTPKKTHLC